MRSPFCFISSSDCVVTLDMAGCLELGELAQPEVAPGQLGMGDGQARLIHRPVAKAHDVEVEGPWPPALAPLASAVALDRAARGQERPRRERRLELHHLVQ